MRKHYLMLSLLLLWSSSLLAAGTRYIMRVDGLACPYCAYGIEKKLKKIEGVQTAQGVKLTEPQMIELFKDAGFTYRSMQEKPL